MSSQTQKSRKQVVTIQSEKTTKPTEEQKVQQDSQDQSEKVPLKHQSWSYCNDTSGGPHSLCGF